MTKRNLEKALDIVSELIMGRAVEKKGDNASLYQEYQNNSEVYDMVQLVLKKMNILRHLLRLKRSKYFSLLQVLWILKRHIIKKH